MKRVVAVLAVILSVLVLLPVPARTDDAPGCEGLAAFRDELFPIGEQWADDLADLGISDPLTMSSDDWLAYAELSLETHRALKGVDAPAWAEDWLTVRIDTTALQEQIGRAAATGGVFITLGFSDAIDAIEQRDTETREAAIEHCADFAQFAYEWDALDGEVDGTPVAA